MKKILLTVLTLFLGLTLYGQFPNSGNRMLLGRQTTAKYLVWMGSIGDTATIEPSSMNEAWIMIDTATNYIYGYRQKAWRLLYTNAIMPFDSITFNTAKDGTVGVGEVEYSDSYGSLIQGLKGGNVTNVIGQQIHQRVTNTTGGTLTKGTAVFLYGSQGNRITVRKALATVDSTSANTFGIVAENITDGQSGYVITEGLLTNMNTNALTEGQAVYLSPTVAGQLTSTEPQAPQHTVYIGVCVKQNTGSGELFVKIRNGQEIDELHDVVITSPTSNASLYYNAAQRVWRDTIGTLFTSDTSDFVRDFQISGTTGQVAYFNSANSVTSDTAFRWSASNKTLSINTATTSGANIIVKNNQEPLQTTVVTSQTFSADTTNWTRGTGWTFNGTVAVATTATGNLTYTPSLTITSGNAYQVTYTVTGYSAGTLTAAVGNVTYTLPTQNANANSVLLIPTSGTGGFRFTTSTFTGNLDNVSIVEVSNRAPVLFAGQDDNTSTLYSELIMPNSTSMSFGGGNRYQTGTNSLSLGTRSLFNVTSGSDNTGFGYQSLRFTTTGSYNTAIGSEALYTNTSGSYNMAIGYRSLFSNTTSSYNTAIGANALLSNVNGSFNIAIASDALRLSSTGLGNVAIGTESLRFNTTGSTNTGIGYQALKSDTLSGSNNIGIGNAAGDNIKSSAAGNVAIGNQVDFPIATGSNQGVYQNVLFFTGASGTGTTIASGARAGIKTNSPQSDFHVAGKVRVDDFKPSGTLRNIVGSTTTGDLSTIAWGNGLTIAISDTILRVDTSVIASKVWANLKLNISDTSSMLLPYLRKSQMRGTAGYIAKYATDSTLTNSIIRESGTKIGINSAAGTNYTTTIYNDDSGGAPGGTAGAITITLASSKTNNKGINITATSGGGDNYTGVDATVSNGTISNIGVKGTATFGAVAVGGLFSASDASTNYGIQINSGMSSDTATYAIHSASNAKVYFNGNVGIRTPAPDSTLTVTGTGNFSSNVRVGGRLGVNTATPGSILTVVGTASLGNGAANSTGSGYNATVTSGGSKATTANNTLLALLSNDALASNPLGLFMDLSNNSTATSRHARLQVGEYGTGNYRSLILQPDGGLVGIRNSSPDSVLTITGGIRTTTSINTGSDATINGLRVGRGTSDNVNSVAVGSEALISATAAGNSNIAVGYRALKSNTTGFYNTAIGLEALTTNTTVANLTAIGFQALRANTTGYYNTAVGSESLKATTIGHNNTAIGIATLRDNTTGIGNTAMGSLALLLPTGASYNVAIGTEALENDSTGSSNVAVGSFALTSNKTGNENTGVGHASLLLNTTGVNNSALGTNSARGNTTGGSNTAIGSYSLYTNSTGSNNVAVGSAALFANTASNNTAIGVSSLTSNTTGAENTAVGQGSLATNTTGLQNTSVGRFSMSANTVGYENAALGHFALAVNTTGFQNTSMGASSLRFNTTGNANSAFGYLSLFSNTTASNNTAVGFYSLYANTTGSNNTALGLEAGRYVTAGTANETSTNSLYLGYDSRASASGNTNETVIGYLARGNGSNTTTIGNTSTTSTLIPAGNLTVASTTADSTLRVNGTGNFTSNVRVGGNLGVGTATPSYRIQATRATEVGLYLNASGAGNIAPPSTYAPGAGGLLYAFGSQAGDNFRRFLDIVADGSAGSAGSVIRFFTGNTATAERARINQDGELLVGTATDNGAFNLQVSGTGYFSTGLRVDYTSAFDANTVFQMPNTSTKGAKGFVWATYSDARIKDNFDTIQNAIQIINSLRPLYYNQYDSEVVDGEIVTGDTNIRTVGFVAQEVVDVIPQAVQIGNQTQLWGMDYTKIIPFLTKAIQEQQSQIEDLKKQIQEIKSQINK